MSAVRIWNLLLRAFSFAVGILALGLFAFWARVIESPHVAFWPTSGLLNLDGLQEGQPYSRWGLIAALQVTIWTLILYGLIRGFDAFRRSSSGRL